MPRGLELAFTFFASWIVLGVFFDGWAHNHHRPESFITPWHAVVDSGFLATIAFGCWVARRRRRAGGRIGDVAGERLTAVGIIGLGVGGACDFVWHFFLGIEPGVQSLWSPPHLLMMCAGLLVATAPLRASLATRVDPAPTFTAIAPTLYSAALTAASVGFFLQYVQAFRGEVASSTTAFAGQFGYPEMYMVIGTSGVLLTTAVLLVPTLLLVQRWRLPPGSLTLVFGVAATLWSSLDGFRRFPIVLPALAAGIVCDWLVAHGRRSLVGVAMPATAWPLWFVALKLTGPMVWPATVWGGTILLAILIGLALQILSAPPRPVSTAA
jgi:hypothetical protein